MGGFYYKRVGFLNTGIGPQRSYSPLSSTVLVHFRIFRGFGSAIRLFAMGRGRAQRHLPGCPLRSIRATRGLPRKVQNHRYGRTRGREEVFAKRLAAMENLHPENLLRPRPFPGSGRHETQAGADDLRPLANFLAHVAVAGHPVVADAFVVDPVDQFGRSDGQIRRGAGCRGRPSGSRRPRLPARPPDIRSRGE